jgi:N-acyl-D-aspartate/D-glutamate deacylase
MILTVLEGGWIVDGTGQSRYATDLAIERGRIARIGDCSGLEARSRIDARGKMVAPGFVDPGAYGRAKYAQGVTTDLGIFDELDARSARPRFVQVTDIDDIAPEAHLHVSNLRVEWARSRSAIHQLLERIDRANDRGARITADVTPYIATWISLATLLPIGVTPEMLADDGVAAMAALEMQARLDAKWDDIFVEGEPVDARRAIQILRKRDDEDVYAFARCLNEDDIATAFSAAFCVPGSHARVAGAFPRLFGRYVRAKGVLSLEEAVARAAALPARTFGLRERGTIRVGNHADVIVFDEATFRDGATYERPDALPVGLTHVFVNGEPT